MKMSSLIKLSILSYVVTYLALTVKVPNIQPTNQSVAAVFVIFVAGILTIGLFMKPKQ